ncbi:hypothetical protein [Serratia ficaria]|uniref:hypothetical protein n=1 Tax=Serratia ficaria TaxID=61651 RepID=UPI00217C2D9F|nr:hypothetical protein [Serratia ficaria]CAI1124306.1 Uncharacterised protein [Serratia ficaria]CAI1541250.1 Uncharacterised protein [Serratia ficaria]
MRLNTFVVLVASVLYTGSAFSEANIETCVGEDVMPVITSGLIKNIKIGYMSINNKVQYNCSVIVTDLVSRGGDDIKFYGSNDSGNDAVTSCLFANEIYAVDRPVNVYGCKIISKNEIYLRTIEFNTRALH